ncbi:MAG: family 43 glycosylhydrolase [Prevotellaceae bacterium]|jgi:hypothetical protein|nr:family 43 glycosylhydrolase [Prevotellaceae bacterium]
MKTTDAMYRLFSLIKKNSLLCTVVLTMTTVALRAQNPISPAGVYIADPTARVDSDGKMYIYGSLDESCERYCSPRYHVLSSSDLRHWQLHENTFRSDDAGAAAAGHSLYAPDMIYRDSTYYLYYCLDNGGEGVAVSGSPAGVFRHGKTMEGISGIDPTVFIDDDGQAYYYWGQFAAKGARLHRDMTSIDRSSITGNLLTEQEHFFHEGGFMFKRHGIYYFVYAHIGRQDRPTCIGYATSRTPLGPFAYGGVIIDNAGADPAAWNNHGSVVEFRGQWYVLYHRPTHGCDKMRRACIEPITFRPDGSIAEAPMTSQGAGQPLSAFARIDAGRACLLAGNVRIATVDPPSGNEALTAIRHGDRATWKYIDYGNGAAQCRIRVRAQAGGRIDVAAGYPWSESLGGVDVPAHSDWTTYTFDIRPTEGVHPLLLRFYGGEGDLFDIDWAVFVETLKR